jgi:hypothetical protein
MRVVIGYGTRVDQCLWAFVLSGLVRRAAVAGEPRGVLSGAQGKVAEPIERGDELIGPGSVVGDAEPGSATGADDLAGDDARLHPHPNY